jgi:hypothetical protein
MGSLSLSDNNYCIFKLRGRLGILNDNDRGLKFHMAFGMGQKCSHRFSIFLLPLSSKGHVWAWQSCGLQVAASTQKIGHQVQVTIQNLGRINILIYYI